METDPCCPCPEAPALALARLPHEQLARLTPAERRVLGFLCAGYSNKEIATALGRAEPTVKHQVSACLRKFGQPSRARLVSYVVLTGMTVPLA